MTIQLSQQAVRAIPVPSVGSTLTYDDKIPDMRFAHSPKEAASRRF